MSIIQNDWKLLQNYFKKINFATIEIEEKEKKNGRRIKFIY